MFQHRNLIFFFLFFFEKLNKLSIYRYIILGNLDNFSACKYCQRKQRNNFRCDTVSGDEACEISIKKKKKKKKKKKRCELACSFYNIET